MKKRIFSIFLSLLITLSMIQTTAFAAASDITFTVTASKTTGAVAGDVIDFSVYVTSTIDVTGIQYKVNVPEGMTYVEGSGALADGLKATTNADADVSWTESTQILTLSSLNKLENLDNLLTATFQCKVDENAEGGNKNVTIDIQDVTDTNWDSYDSSHWSITPATINITIPSTGITLNKTSLSLKTGASETLTATLDPANSTDTITWKSSAESVATVTGGTVTAVGVGSATITATTSSGKSATCVVTVECAHGNTKATAAKEATCGEDGCTGYWECLDCKGIFSDSACTTPTELEDTVIPATGNHTGGTATCKKLAECGVCGKEYGKLADHTPEADDGDCTTAIKCSVCDEVTTAAKASHTGGTATCKEKAKCAECGKEYGEFADHTPEADDGDCTTAIICSVCDAVTTAAKTSHTGGTATCKEKAKCENCGTAYGELADCIADKDDGDCTTDILCSVCKKVLTEGADSHTPKADDGDCTTAITCSVCGTITTAAKASHTGGTATCKEKAKCAECGKEYGKLANHTPKADDGDCTTEITCSVCGTVTTKAQEHNLKWVQDVAATEELTGLKHQECQNEGCKYETSLDTVIPKLEHVHNMAKTEKKDATCTEKGNIEYYTCTKCEKVYEDETALNEITDMSKAEIAALGHDFTELETDADNHWYSCSRCDMKDDKSVAKHTYEDGKCTVCEYVQDAVIISGENAIYTTNSSSSLSFTSDGDFDRFVEVRVDGSVVAPENYTVSKGSTVVTLKKEYIATLSIGAHTIDIVFTNNDVATCKFICVSISIPSTGAPVVTTAPATTPTTTAGTSVTTKPADDVADDTEDVDDDSEEDIADDTDDAIEEDDEDSDVDSDEESDDTDTTTEADDTDSEDDENTDDENDNVITGEDDENPFTGVAISFAGVAVSLAAVVMTIKRNKK